jgi:hypothetical protein
MDGFARLAADSPKKVLIEGENACSDVAFYMIGTNMASDTNCAFGDESWSFWEAAVHRYGSPEMPTRTAFMLTV